MMLSTPVCNGCQRTPAEIDEYIDAAANYYYDVDDEMSPAEYVMVEEGTYNPENGHFLCTACYVAAGMPVGPHGWTAP